MLPTDKATHRRSLNLRYLRYLRDLRSNRIEWSWTGQLAEEVGFGGVVGGGVGAEGGAVTVVVVGLLPFRKICSPPGYWGFYGRFSISA